MDKTNKGSLSIQSLQQTTFPSKKVSHDKIKISDLCYRKNAHLQNQIQIKPYISQAQENIMLCQKTKADERRSTQIEQELSADIIAKLNTENQSKNLQIADYINNGINLKVLKINNNTPKSNCQKNLQIAKNVKIPNKANVMQQPQSSTSQIQNKKTHLKHQTLLHDRARSNGTEEDESKQIFVACSNSPQSRNTLTGTNSEFFKQQMQVYSQRDTRYQLNKQGDKKKKSVGSNEQTGLKFDESSNSKKQRNRSDQMGGKQLFTLNSQNQFSTLPKQQSQLEQLQNNMKRNNEVSQEKQKIIHNESKESSKTTSVDKSNNLISKQQQSLIQQQLQNQLPKKNQQQIISHNIQQNVNKTTSQENYQPKNNETSQDKKVISDKSQEKRLDSNGGNSQTNRYKLKEAELQKFSKLFLQQQKKQSQDMTKKYSISAISKKEQQNTFTSQNQDGSLNFIPLQKQQQDQTHSQVQIQGHKQKSPEHILIDENKATQKQKKIKTERQQLSHNEISSTNQQHYGRINNKETINQISLLPFGATIQINNQQTSYINSQENNQKQRMVSLNSRQSIVHSNNQQLEDEDLATLQQFSSPFLRSSSSSKEPNRRYEKQPLEKKSEIDKKIKEFLESKQQQNTSSQDLSSRQQMAATPSVITNSTSNNTNKSGNSNHILLSSNLLSSNIQQLSKENSRQPTQNSNQQFQVNQLNLEESQLHFYAEDAVSHYSQGSSIKKNLLHSQKDGNSINMNSNNTPHRQQKAQLKSSVNCQLITPSTCDGKQQVTLVSPMISNFVISPSSKVITLSPKPYLTTENEEQEDQDMIITFSENINTEGSEDVPLSKLQSIEEKDENQHKRNKTFQPYNSKQDQINNKLESRLGALEQEMSSIIQRCVNLEVTNKSLNTNIEKISAEKEIIQKENEIYKLKIEELQLINKQQEDTIEKLLCKVTQQNTTMHNNLSISQLKTNRNKTDCSNQIINTENSTAELSQYQNAENMSSFSQSKGFYKCDAFSSARGAPISAQNNYKSKKEINQYFSNMINNSQSKQLMLPQTFQGYLSQKNLQNLMANSQIQNSNSLTHNDSILTKHTFSQSTKNQQQFQQQQQQQQQQQTYHFQNGNCNFEDEQAQVNSYRNDYYLSSRHGIQNLYKQ